MERELTYAKKSLKREAGDRCRVAVAVPIVSLTTHSRKQQEQVMDDGMSISKALMAREHTKMGVLLTTVIRDKPLRSKVRRDKDVEENVQVRHVVFF